MIWLKRLSIALLVLLLLAMLGVYLTPLDTYVPELEQILSEQMQQPVKLRHIRIAVMPLPHLELQDVRLGEGEQERISVRSVDVELDLPGLLLGKAVVRRILVKDGTAYLAQVRKLANRFARVPVATERMMVRELQFTGVSLLAPEMSLGPLEGKLTFLQSGKLERAWFAMDEQKVTVILQPQQDMHFALQLQARNWLPPRLPQIPPVQIDDLQLEGVLSERDFVAQRFTVTSLGMHASGSANVDFADGWQVRATLSHLDAPLEQLISMLGKPIELSGAISAKGTLSAKAANLGALQEDLRFTGDVLVEHASARIASGFQHPLLFDQIRARVEIRPDSLNFSGLEAKLYSGKVTGTASINRKSLLLVADIAVSDIAMQPLVEALSNEVLFTGRMDSADKISMRLDEFDKFPSNVQLNGSFHLRNGVLTKVDLVQAASNPGKANGKGGKGGTTRFDDLTGLLNVDASGYHFRKLKIVSGSLNAEGRVDVSPAMRLSGALDTNVKGTVGLVSMPMVVSGTLSNPVVAPSGSALAGAAVGTAILGPGLGTAIGIKIGGFLNKLFGNGNEKNDAKQGAQNTPVKK